jgi:hypothetical protein
VARYASGAYSVAVCDRCGMEYPYTSLKKEWNNLKTCTECWEAKHPQLDPIYPPPEPQAIFEPRPDRVEPMDVPVGQEIFPFIQNISTQGVTSVGIVTVQIGGS